MRELTYVGGPLDGLAAPPGTRPANMRDGNGHTFRPRHNSDEQRLPAYHLRDCAGRATPEGRLIRVMEYVWRPGARVPIVAHPAPPPCPDCGAATAIRGDHVDVACVNRRCGWFNLTCRGCGAAPRREPNGLALCAGCLRGEFRHLAGEVRSR